MNQVTWVKVILRQSPLLKSSITCIRPSAIPEHLKTSTLLEKMTSVLVPEHYNIIIINILRIVAFYAQRKIPFAGIFFTLLLGGVWMQCGARWKVKVKENLCLPSLRRTWGSWWQCGAGWQSGSTSGSSGEEEREEHLEGLPCLSAVSGLSW